ncbi:hypothetical protein [Hymenobacter sp. CRA2]|uniref:hypothetical protein n=1 Tax=Hymenobacter sp. CRA2 TaxID=1955620 RepID=UPI00098F6B73|nr:hypothetical protein [Hymenobacter sp. CRA2]OON70293.1 hypothetical protein B0919_06060 [Hymenobacter sp. CRA2]
MNDSILPKQTTHLFVPSSIDALMMLPTKRQQKHVDKYHYILHLIYIARKVDKRNTSASFINLNAKLLEAVLHARDYLTYIEYWIEQGVIECDNRYIPGEKSKGYRFTKAYQEARVKRVPIKDAKFRAKLTSRKQLYLNKTDWSDTTLSFLHHNLKAIRVDAVRALNFAHELSKNEEWMNARRERRKKGRKSTSSKEGKVEKPKFNDFNMAVYGLVSEDYFFTRDKIGKRVHNNFVNFPSALRSFLYLDDGEQLVNLDVRNSQPLMLCVLLKQHYEGHKLPLDVYKYIDECEKGKFYECFADAVGVPIKNRKKFKQALFTNVFFGKNMSCVKSRAFRGLIAHYPNVASFITEFKRKDHKSLAIALQRVESEIIIDDVIDSLAKEYHPNDFFALTIHDSICTTLSNRDEVMGRMKQAFERKGISVDIKTEYLEQPDTELLQAA